MFLTDRIWSFTGEGLLPREGAITLDEGEHIIDQDDLQRPVYVGGLQPADFAVFLSIGVEEDENLIGCLVSHVDANTGEGIIVGGDAVEERPRLWLQKPFIERLRMLDTEEWEEFSLTALHTYLQSGH